MTASSSDTTSSPSHSPHQFAASGQETSKPRDEQVFRQQFRKGKYVSPVWKPNEMMWLARAWRVQYQGGSEDSIPSIEGAAASVGDVAAATGRGKTRADKDKKVAEFLNRHGVNRDAKTVGTK
ncbi:unnamed protein product [Fraxinus pennsylvanica]|uniref:Uncharacterized protein n=1 Tax=Fraxinus pennsylvanica TaxID=56036 RepID=A0AAD2DR43_9LAMI|nr:unnamed protein product [Fraxinus pennsylvanica]